MKSLTSAAIVAITAAVIGGAGLATSSYAQQGPQGGPQMQMPGGPGQHQQFGPRGQMRDMRAERMGGLLDLVCSERGGEQLEVAFVRLSHRLDLTADQQPLFDTLKSTALTAQTAFADTCAAARPTATADQQATPRNPVEGMQARIAIEKAHTAALETVLPAFEAFYASLSDEQKAAFAPERGKGPRGPHMGQGQMQPGQPGGPAGDDAPGVPNG